jgi:hypothetical protein
MRRTIERLWRLVFAAVDDGLNVLDEWVVPGN